MVLGGFSERRVFPARWQPTVRISSVYPDSAGASKDEQRGIETDAGVTRLSSEHPQTGSTVSVYLYPAKALALRRAADSHSLYVGLCLSAQRKKEG